MKTLSHAPALFLGAALAFTPVFGMAQHGAAPETAIPRHTDKGGHGNFAPPPDRKAPPDTHRDIPAHPDRAKQNNKKEKNSGAGDRGGAGSKDATGSGTGTANP